MKDPVQAALNFAQQLDRTLMSRPSDEVEETLLAIGELCGGLSDQGFKGDLLKHMDDMEQKALSEAVYPDYSPGRGGNDPDHWVSGRLCDDITRDQEHFCCEWLEGAQKLMAPHVQTEAAA